METDQQPDGNGTAASVDVRSGLNGTSSSINNNRAPRPTNPRASSNAQAVENARKPRPGMKEYIRIRSDSVGSTRGAFTGGGTRSQTNTAPIEAAKQQQQQKTNSPGRRAKQPPASSTDNDPPVPVDLSAEASLAIASSASNSNRQLMADSDDNISDGLSSPNMSNPKGIPPSLPSGIDHQPKVVSPSKSSPQKKLPRPVPTRAERKPVRQDSMRGTFLKSTTAEVAPTIQNLQAGRNENDDTNNLNRHSAFVDQHFDDANLRGDALLFSPEANQRGGGYGSTMDNYGSSHLAGSQIMGSTYFQEGANSTYFDPSHTYGAPPPHYPPAGALPPPHYGGYPPMDPSLPYPPPPHHHQGAPMPPIPNPYYDMPGNFYQPSQSSLPPPNYQKEQSSQGMCARLSASFVSYCINVWDDYYYAPPESIGAFISTVRAVIYDPTNPEFTSLQQFTWSVLIGCFFGILTAIWGQCIESLVDFIWKDIPETLLEWGVFTDLEGHLPLPHYMWICPAVFGGFLAWITEYVSVTIPGQNEWIEALHRQGVLDPTTFWHILVISTMGMMSGLSLGPELPLVLLSGMVGSKLSTMTHQSVLSARVMVLTAGSAAIGGFFGFPMAGALFVLEIPHRMGLQYFEALSPATMASIISVLLNRIVTGNDVKGYFDYPFLAASLKSHVFYIAVFYGVVGAMFGTLYCKGCIALKMWTHNWFHAPHDDHHVAHHEEQENNEVGGENESIATSLENGEHQPLVKKSNDQGSIGQHSSSAKKKNPISQCFHRFMSASIPHEPTRAGVVGVLAGILVGVVSMFLPHNLFWGEAQLQTLIDKGRTPLPVFGRDGEPTELLTAWGYCMVDPEDHDAIMKGPGLTCSFLLTMTKILVIGVSLGTGIVGGHFWGPLYVGAAASNLFIDVMNVVYEASGLGLILYEYPCVALLCIMGATHVVTFRAHTAIMLILTLTISAFQDDQEGTFASGDYSAVFPLLVVSCFVSLMISRDTIFYKQQRCRGDILASPEVLCEPGKVGEPMMPVMPGGEGDEYYNDVYSEDDDDAGASGNMAAGFAPTGEASLGSLSEDSHNEVDAPPPPKTLQTELTSEDIERQFALMQQSATMPPSSGGLSSEPSDFGVASSSSAFVPINPSHSNTSDTLTGPNEEPLATTTMKKRLSGNSTGGGIPTAPTAEASPNGASIDSSLTGIGGAPPRAPSAATSKIDELLSRPMEQRSSSRASNASGGSGSGRRSKLHMKKSKSHRHTMSGSDALFNAAVNAPGDVAPVGRGGRHRASSVDPHGQRAQQMMMGADDGSVASGASSSYLQSETNPHLHSRNGSVVSMRERSGSRDGSRCGTPTSATLVAVKAQGSIQDFQPDLLTQARMRSSSVSRMVPKPDRMHARRKSQECFNLDGAAAAAAAANSTNAGMNGYGGSHRGNIASASGTYGGAGVKHITDDPTGALSAEDIERSFRSLQNQANYENDSMRANGYGSSSSSHNHNHNAANLPYGGAQAPGYPPVQSMSGGPPPSGGAPHNNNSSGNHSGRYSPYARGRVGTDPVS